GLLRRRTDFRGLGLPTRRDQLMHAGACNLVDADKHRLARLPARGAVVDEIRCDLFKTFVRSDDFVVLTEKLVEKGLLIGVELRFLDLVRNRLVQISAIDAEL